MYKHPVLPIEPSTTTAGTTAASTGAADAGTTTASAPFLDIAGYGRALHGVPALDVGGLICGGGGGGGGGGRRRVRDVERWVGMRHCGNNKQRKGGGGEVVLLGRGGID